MLEHGFGGVCGMRWGRAPVRHQLEGGAARGDRPVIVPPVLGLGRGFSVGVLPGVIAGVGEGWVAAAGLPGACFCVRACWRMSEGWLVSRVFGCVRVFMNSATVFGMRA